MTKQEIRKKYRGRREALSNTAIDNASKEIASHFFSSVSLSHARVIHTFLPIASKKEVDTWLIIDQLKKQYPHIKISISKVEGSHLINFYFENKNQLAENAWKILEPAFGETTTSQEIDLVIVPLLAFDKKGNRVGYGKGFYDKFLSECRSDCQKVGLSFFGPMDTEIPTDAYDKKLDLVITPTQAYRFTN